jgi:hypothetical protein
MKQQWAMSAKEYREAIADLGLSQIAAGRWLGVSDRTAQNYAANGCDTRTGITLHLALQNIREIVRLNEQRELFLSKKMRIFEDKQDATAKTVARLNRWIAERRRIIAELPAMARQA